MNWKKCRDLYKAKTGVGCDGFHPKVPPDVTEETRENRTVLGEGRAEWKVAARSMHDDVLLDFETYHE